jgi:putative aldouronate transport system permease protein
MKRSKNTRRTAAFDVMNAAFLSLLAFLMIYPFWEMLVLSFTPATQASELGFKIVPTGFTLEAYRRIFASKVMGYGYFNTIFRTVVGTAIAVFLCFCTAYPLAKKTLPARRTLTVFYLIPMFFGGGLIPEFLLVKGLGLFDTIWALILPCLLGTYNLLIMRNFLMTIPESLEESARVDGAGVFTVLVRIVIPLSMPILATIALWVAVMHWNAWFDAMIYTRSNTKVVLQLLLRRVLIEDKVEGITDSLQGDEGVITRTMEAATILVTIGPIVAAYPFLQKYFIKGVLVGSLKG